ncbi:MAG: thioredoxin family protein [Armatimonadetes bacterium]|nr:thioredoxin family protein [Armatimonadota bacterium]
MATTESAPLPLSAPAPDFSLPDVVSGGSVSLESFAGKKALLVVFASPHCPFVQHVKGELARMGRDYGPQGVGVVMISANDAVQYPGDGPDGLKAFAQEQGFTFPVLYDESQATARAYTAVCTPDTFIFDDARRLVYRGRFDETRPNSGSSATGAELRAALDAVLAGTPVPTDQKASIGCGIKWKPGNAPAYVSG